MSKLDETQPLMRGQQVRANYRSVETFEGRVRSAIQKHIPDSVAEVIKEKRSWLPVELDVAVCEAVGKVVGDEGLKSYSAKCVHLSASRSVVSSLLTGAAKLFKLNPQTFISFGPTAWGSFFRNFGLFEYHDLGEHKGEIHLVRLPEMIFDRQWYFVAICGAFQGVIEASGRSGKVDVLEISRENRMARFGISWE
jgi:hypothetical protein